jgi:hypothetical protein
VDELRNQEGQRRQDRSIVHGDCRSGRAKPFDQYAISKVTSSVGNTKVAFTTAGGWPVAISMAHMER